MKVFDHTTSDFDTRIEQGKSKQQIKDARDLNIILCKMTAALILLYIVTKYL